MRLIYILLRALVLCPLYGVIVTLAIIGTKRNFRGSRPEIVGNLHYGSNFIGPEHLAIWYFVRTNVDLEEAKTSGLVERVEKTTRDLLSRYLYPKTALPKINISIESNENVDKGGGWEYFRSI